MDTKEAGRLGGSKNTPAQNAARRENGKKGGRPPKPKPVTTPEAPTFDELSQEMPNYD